MCAHGTREGHPGTELWARLGGHTAGFRPAQPVWSRPASGDDRDSMAAVEAIDAMVPQTTALELDDGGILCGAPDWPTWIADRAGPAPMWITDATDASTVEQLAELFGSTGLWPVRLLEDSGERLALMPVQRPADIPARLRWRIPGRRRDTGVTLSSLLRSWEDRVGAVLVAIGEDTVILDAKSGPTPRWMLCWSRDGHPAPPHLTTE